MLTVLCCQNHALAGNIGILPVRRVDAPVYGDDAHDTPIFFARLPRGIQVYCRSWKKKIEKRVLKAILGLLSLSQRPALHEEALLN